MFDAYNIAWEFHRNTSRWPYNMLTPDDEIALVPPFKEYFSLPNIRLPESRMPPITISDAMAARCSCRKYTDRAVELDKLAIILKAGYGVLGKSFVEDMELFERPVPSGGGLYPLELYVLALNIEGLEKGVHHYAANCHMLERIRSVHLDPLFITNLFMHQPYLLNCAAIIVVTSVVDRNMRKYADRGYRYVLFEAGHCVQNMNLMSCGLELGSLNLGGFFDSELANLLELDIGEEIPLYCMALGIPDSKSKSATRMPTDANT